MNANKNRKNLTAENAKSAEKGKGFFSLRSLCSLWLNLVLLLSAFCILPSAFAQQWPFAGVETDATNGVWTSQNGTLTQFWPLQTGSADFTAAVQAVQTQGGGGGGGYTGYQPLTNAVGTNSTGVVRTNGWVYIGTNYDALGVGNTIGANVTNAIAATNAATLATLASTENTLGVNLTNAVAATNAATLVTLANVANTLGGNVTNAIAATNSATLATLATTEGTLGANVTNAIAATNSATLVTLANVVNTLGGNVTNAIAATNSATLATLASTENTLGVNLTNAVAATNAATLVTLANVVNTLGANVTNAIAATNAATLAVVANCLTNPPSPAAGQVLTNNGSGGLGWGTPASGGGGSVPNGLVTNNSAYLYNVLPYAFSTPTAASNFQSVVVNGNMSVAYGIGVIGAITNGLAGVYDVVFQDVNINGGGNAWVLTYKTNGVQCGLPGGNYTAVAGSGIIAEQILQLPANVASTFLVSAAGITNGVFFKMTKIQ